MEGEIIVDDDDAKIVAPSNSECIDLSMDGIVISFLILLLLLRLCWNRTMLLLQRLELAVGSTATTMVGANPVAVWRRHMRGRRRSTIVFVNELVIVMV